MYAIITFDGLGKKYNVKSIKKNQMYYTNGMMTRGVYEA